MVNKMNKKLSIKDIEWKEFNLGEIFSIENCKCSSVSNIPKGKTPYVGATNRNNGVLSFLHDTKLITKGNCIAFICDGEGSVGYSIYKKEDFIGSTTVKVGRNENINFYTGTFITTIADKVRSKYNFGYKRNTENLKREKLLLPELNNLPNWNFMEDYMRQVEEEIMEKEIVYFEDKLIENLKVPALGEKEWGEFFINEIFEKVQRGKRLIKAEQKEGNKPYISSTALVNGIDNFISNDEKVRGFSNCLTIANSGSVGKVFFHPYKFIASDHVTALKHNGFNKYHYIFLSLMIERLAEKYSYNREINNKRIQNEKILLPIKKENVPDWEYMENYMKNIEYKSIKKWLEYKNKKQD